MKSLRWPSTCANAAYSRRGAEFSGSEFLARLTELLLDFQLDKEPGDGPNPARKAESNPRQSFGLPDNVFQRSC